VVRESFLPKDYFFFVAFFAAFFAGAFLAAFFAVAMVSILPFRCASNLQCEIAVREGIWFLENCVKKKITRRLTLLILGIEKSNANSKWDTTVRSASR